ncbi:ribosome maturation factor RimP [Williamwhitmania taraxaci]|uniref:Ribosome maturation factor RimP n=2 Tax=Williamwhitmania taraxaci TaxID=1640674 RepID=A0A1G6LZW7_9BACT|nr:ribosome maturation factor RimP [Williamwhitmania taraxaci]
MQQNISNFFNIFGKLAENDYFCRVKSTVDGGGGTGVPHFIMQNSVMLKQEEIRELVKQEAIARGLFLVDVKVNNQNVIEVEIDSEGGIGIKECIEVNKAIEALLDREKNDFELTVASPGLGQPLKVFEQYQKNIGKTLDIVTVTGEKLKGVLLEASLEEGIALEVSEKRVVDGTSRKRAMVVEVYKMKLEEIKTAKVVISFK